MSHLTKANSFVDIYITSILYAAKNSLIKILKGFYLLTMSWNDNYMFTAGAVKYLIILHEQHPLLITQR